MAASHQRLFGAHPAAFVPASSSPGLLLLLSGELWFPDPLELRVLAALLERLGRQTSSAFSFHLQVFPTELQQDGSLPDPFMLPGLQGVPPCPSGMSPALPPLLLLQALSAKRGRSLCPSPSLLSLQGQRPASGDKPEGQLPSLQVTRQSQSYRAGNGPRDLTCPPCSGLLQALPFPRQPVSLAGSSY